jgi:hypothetical protein
MMDRWPLSLEWWNIGDEKAISYRGAVPSKESNVSVWLIAFYSAVIFFAHTVPPPGSPQALVEPVLEGWEG